MAIKHVITMGFGFADGTVFLPTLGYTPGEEVDFPSTLEFEAVVSRSASHIAYASREGSFAAVATRTAAVAAVIEG